MARVPQTKNQKRLESYATVRIKGHPSVSRTFDTKGEAAAWAAKTAEKRKAQKYNDPRLALQITLQQALTKYLETISSKKALNTHMREKVAAKRLLEKIGSEIALGSISPAIAAHYRDARLQEVSAYPVRAERALLHTGMRASEAAGLYWNQVNLKERVIFLPNTKNKDTRWVSLTKELTEELSNLKRISKGKNENLIFFERRSVKNGSGQGKAGNKIQRSIQCGKKKSRPAGHPHARSPAHRCQPFNYVRS